MTTGAKLCGETHFICFARVNYKARTEQERRRMHSMLQVSMMERNVNSDVIQEDKASQELENKVGERGFQKFQCGGDTMRAYAN